MTHDDRLLEQRLVELFDSPQLEVRPRPEACAIVMRGARRRRRARQQVTAAAAVGVLVAGVLAAGLYLPWLPLDDRPGVAAGGSPASGPPAATKSSPAMLTMTRAGVGPLRLGMSREQALATGLLTDPTAYEAPRQECVHYAGENGISWVVIGSRGVESIAVSNPFLGTPEGLQVGDRFWRVRQLYPTVRTPSDWKAAATARAPVPGVPGAWYKISIDATGVKGDAIDDARVGALALVDGSGQCDSP